MKKIIPLLFLFYFSFTAIAQVNPQDSAWIRDNYTKKEVYITMRDGVKLFTAIYLPKDATEKHPILMTRTPYSCAPYGEQNFNSGLMDKALEILCKGKLYHRDTGCERPLDE